MSLILRCFAAVVKHPFVQNLCSGSPKNFFEKNSSGLGVKNTPQLAATGIFYCFKKLLCNNKSIILCLILLFVAVRLFVSGPAYLIAGDEARYLGLAANFPYHTLYGTIFLQHMPMYSYLIAIINYLFSNDLVSALFVSFFMEVFLLFILVFWFRLLHKSNNWIFIFILFFSLNWPLAEFSRIVFKETTYFAFFWTTIVLYWYGLKKHSKWFYLSAIAGALTAFSSDQVIFLFPILIITLFLIKDNNKNLWKKYIPIIATLAAYSFWLFIRINYYISHVAAPIGVDGVIEETQDFSLMQVFSPFSFSESKPLTEAQFTLNIPRMASTIGYLFNMYPFLIQPHLNIDTAYVLLELDQLLFIIIWYIPLVFILLTRVLHYIKKTFHDKLYFDNVELVLMIYFIILIAPMSTGVGVWRHIMLSIVVLFYFLTDGLNKLLFNFMKKELVKCLFVIFSLLFVIFWLVNNPYFSFFSDKIVQGHSLVNEFESLPDGGIFVQSGYSMEAPYLMPNKRIYGIPGNITKFANYINMFNISYIVLGNKTWSPAPEKSLSFIKSRPDLFIKSSQIVEVYPNNTYPTSRFATDYFWIYRVNSSY